MTDIIIRDCGRVGFLAIVETGGKEVWRIGNHAQSAQEAFQAAMNWLEYVGEL